MKTLLIVAAVSFALGHYWKIVVGFITSKLVKK